MRAFHAGELVPSPTTLTRQPAAGTLSRRERARPQGAGEGITPKRLIRKGLFSWLLDLAQALSLYQGLCKVRFFAPHEALSPSPAGGARG